MTISNELKAEFAALEIEISDAKVKLHRLEKRRLEIIGEAYGVAPGTRVRDLKGREFEVDRVETAWSGLGRQPWLKGRLIKKDGKPRAKAATVYDWEVVQ